jgi:hypothetical protein
MNEAHDLTPIGVERPSLPCTWRPGREIIQLETPMGADRGTPIFLPRTEEIAMATLAEVQARNRELARRINEEALRNPRSPYAGKFVGIANGQVVVVADSLEEMAQRLEQIEPDPAKCFSVEASRDYDEVVEIGSLR